MSLTIPQTALDLQLILQDRLEMQPKDFEKQFDVAEADGKLVLSVHRDSNGKCVWLETHLWIVVNDYVRVLGGEWFKEQREWHVLVKKPNSTPKDAPVPKEIKPYASMRERIEKKLEGPIPLAKPDAHERMENNIHNLKEAGEQLEADGYDLKKSKEALGTLIPILTDVHGNIIDGFHREKIDADWPRVKASHITDPVHLSMARLAANVCRRDVPPEEKTKLLANIAELTGWNPKQIAEAIGMSYDWVVKYLPDTFKDEQKAEVGTIGGQTTAQRFHEAQQSALQRQPKSDDIRQEASFESESITPTVPVEKIDTGLIFECPECGFKATHIHISSKHHKLEEVIEV